MAQLVSPSHRSPRKRAAASPVSHFASRRARQMIVRGACAPGGAIELRETGSDSLRKRSI